MVTILILIDGFLQSQHRPMDEEYDIVTILILIDGFLQYTVIVAYARPLWSSQSLF